MRKKIFQLTIMLLGMGLFAHLLMQLGWETLKANLLLVGWWFLAILALGFIMFLMIVRAWQIILLAMGHRVAFGKLLKLKIIAEAINDATPTANLGGDGARILLLKEELSGTSVTGSVILDKTADNLGKLLFMVLGVILSVWYITIPADWLWGSVLLLIIVSLLNLGFIALQWAGVSGMVSAIARSLPFLQKYYDQFREKFSRFDSLLKEIYVHHTPTLLISTGWHFFRRCLNLAEIWLIIWLLTGNPDPFEAIYVSSMTTVASNAYFIIPGQWGIAEGTQVLLMQAIGHLAPVGISLGVIRRLRLLFFTGVGLLLLQGAKA